MRPAKFEYFDPHTIDEALKLLETHGEEAKILAGGLSLVPTMKLRLAVPKYLIDITKIPTLSYILEDNDGGLRIGALTTYYALASSSLVQSKFPILVEVANGLGSAQIRNRGTLGGNICHADPACDFAPPLLALNAEFKALSSKGERTINSSNFFVDLFKTLLKFSELLTEIRIPSPLPRTGGAYLKLGQRSGDFAIVSAAAVLSIDQKNNCKAARIGLGSVGPMVLRAEETEKFLMGKGVTDKLIEEGSELAARGIKPSSDIHASMEYRTDMAKVITKRALHEAFKRARGEK